MSIAEGPGLAHDAGNLLGALGLYCDLLDLPGVLRPEHLHYARELRLLSQRSGALINRLLEGDKASLEPIRSLLGEPPKRLCPSTVLRSFTPLLRSLAAPDAELSMAVSLGLPVLPFAAEILERILVNLTRNAAMAIRGQSHVDDVGNPVAGQIHIGICGNTSRLTLTVLDNGPGMTPAVMAAFLKPAPLPHGTLRGLGHRVISDLIQSTGGALSITVVNGCGTTVQVDWPVAPAAITGRKLRRNTREGAALAC